MVKLDFKTRAYARAEAMFHVAKARGTPRSFEDCIPDAMDALAAEERADFARRLAAMEKVVDAAATLCKVRDGVVAVSPLNGIDPNTIGAAEMRRRLDEYVSNGEHIGVAWGNLRTALAALESEVQ